MANSDEESLKAFQRMEKELQTCIVSRSTSLPEHIIQLLASLCSAGQDIILQDFEFAKRKGVENRLWDIHGKINSQFRRQLRQFREASGQRKVVEQRVMERRFLEFIKSSQRFYRGYIQSLGSRFEGVKELKAVANRLTLSTLSIEESAPATDELRRLLLLSCHQNLIRLGDLSRWRETQLETKDRNWVPAIGYYDLAGRIYPASGASHNQLAVIALQDSNHLGAVYHLYFALALEEPHPNAKDNLEVEFKKIEELWSEDELSKRKKKMDTQGLATDIAALFVRLHAYYYKGNVSLEQEDLERKTLKQLAMNLKERSIDMILSKMVLVNIAAEYFAGQRLRNDPESLEALQSFISLQGLNVRMFFTLLDLLQSELERYTANEAFTNGSPRIGHTKFGPAKISAVARRVLPALRQYSSWLLANASILVATNGDEALNVQLNELWRVYAKTLTLLASIFSVDELQLVALNYLLDEDESTLGFSPFNHEIVRRRYFKDGGTSQKPRHHDRDSGVQRQHPNKEMLGRVRDLLTDGMTIQDQEEVPITFVDNNKAFAFQGKNELNESNGQARLPSNATQLEVTYVNETSFPQSASIAASGPITMDIDSKRMVDDLVDSEVGGEPDAIDYVIERNTQSTRPDDEDTSYGLIGSAAVLENFVEQASEAQRHSRPLLPSIEKSPFTLRPDEEQLLASLRSPIHQKSPTHSRHGSQNMPLLQQPSKHFGVSSSNSSMPTPTFQNTHLDRFPADAGHQHPNMHARNVQKALDDSVFRSSNVFPGSTFGNTQNS